MKASKVIMILVALTTMACRDYKPEISRLNEVNEEQLILIRKTMLTKDGNIQNKIEFIAKHGQIKAKYAEKMKNLTSSNWDSWRRRRLLTQEQEEINDNLKRLGFPELVKEP